jgi:hypothetical protein
MTRLGLSSLALGVLLGVVPAAHAVTFVLDGSTGADYDSVGDGWFFTTPPNQPPDGVGDLGGQALAVAKQNGVVELRAMAEFPLSPLSGFTALQVESATLTITIDDVIGGFGPGTAFDGTAGNPLVVFAYPADGTVAVSDFSPAGLTEVGQIATGTITDASLAVSGAVSFEVDVTDELKAALTSGDAAFGALIATLDSPTGTSLDDRGVPGRKFPFLTIETIPTVPPVYSADELACQTTLSKEATKLQAAETKALAGCFDAVLKDSAKNAGVVGASTQSNCEAALDPSDANAKLTKAVAKFADKVLSKCADVAPAAINVPCDNDAAGIGETIECVGAAAQDTAERLIGKTYGNACTLLYSVGLDDDFPAVCVP